MYQEVTGSAKSVLWNFGFLQEIGCNSNLKIHLLSCQASFAIWQLILANCCCLWSNNNKKDTMTWPASGRVDDCWCHLLIVEEEATMIKMMEGVIINGRRWWFDAEEVHVGGKMQKESLKLGLTTWKLISSLGLADSHPNWILVRVLQLAFQVRKS